MLNQLLILIWPERACPDDAGMVDVGAVVDQFLIEFVLASVTD
jgi:hypothetical protein